MAEVGGIAGEQLRTFIERLERLQEEKKDVQEQIKEVFSEAKGGRATEGLCRCFAAMAKTGI